VATNPSTPEPDGVIRQVRSFFIAAGQSMAARLRLARVEGKEASAHLIKILLLIAAAVVLAAFGWLFLCLGVASVLAEAFPNHGWLWASLIVAAAHFALVGVLVAVLKRKAETPLFPLTTEELKKDQEWLEQQKRQH
jgi:uncharacterized membrane protein YqjE